MAKPTLAKSGVLVFWPIPPGRRGPKGGAPNARLESLNVHISRVPAFNNTTKIQRKDPQEEESVKIVAGEGKKSEILCCLGGVPKGGGAPKGLEGWGPEG